LSGARGGDIQQFVDGLETVVGELRSRRARAILSSARASLPMDPGHEFARERT